jgi:hypothetical protein
VSFEDLIRRQLDLFEAECADLIAQCDSAERAYDNAGRDEAEERYGDYLDLVETGTERLAELRDGFARTMAEDAAEAYEAEFNQAVHARLPRFALGIENT